MIRVLSDCYIHLHKIMWHFVKAKQIIKSIRRDYVTDFLNAMFVFHFDCDVAVMARAIWYPFQVT